MQSIAYGFPRLGRKREYKKAIEGYWKGNFDETQLDAQLTELHQQMLDAYAAQVDEYPTGEMTRYDWMIDTAIMLGVYRPADLNDYYELCRGEHALEMTKWFNTNYHYIVPQLDGVEPGDLSLTVPARPEASQAEHTPPRFLIGPFTFFKLSKGISETRFAEYLRAAAKLYRDLLEDYAACHIHEPAFAMDISESERAAIAEAYEIISHSGAQITLFTYYDSVDFLEELFALPVDGFGLDFVHGSENVGEILRIGFPEQKRLVAGLVDGRNVWRTNLSAARDTLEALSGVTSRLAVSNAAPLFHLPVTLEGESLGAQLTAALAFAEEKLEDISHLAATYDSGEREALPQSPAVPGEGSVRRTVEELTEADFTRSAPYEQRRKLQSQRFDLPLFPTTTIGSFPQTREVRKTRAAFRRGEITSEQYQGFIRETIADSIRRQEEIGLDVFVHGEPERSDMVEYFAEKLEGIATTQNGWIISYGTRGYRPPIIYGDISRPEPMTIDEISYAQSLTDKPVKGMLTGPVTIIAWSFTREDIPVHQVAYQLSLSLQKEVADYEEAGIGMVQIDEPAFREMAPNKHRRWADYFDWATRAFRLCVANADPRTQVHSHMCYSEFNEIIDEIQKMDFDVISIEATRSGGEVIDSFEKTDFTRQIGLGVYDIHSPAVPTQEEIERVVQRAVEVIPRENFWINPDCGLKTRDCEEVMPSLKNMVSAATSLRR
ncbi:MAG: 5-methyltetrahydropteroyltriglutamate--homocysteine S-methyltransferase [Spirochaetia bacterium]